MAHRSHSRAFERFNEHHDRGPGNGTVAFEIPARLATSSSLAAAKPFSVKTSSAVSMISAGRASLRLCHFRFGIRHRHHVNDPKSHLMWDWQSSSRLPAEGFQGAGREGDGGRFVHPCVDNAEPKRLATSTTAGSSDRRSNPARLNVFDICTVAHFQTTCRGLVLAEARQPWGPVGACSGVLKS